MDPKACLEAAASALQDGDNETCVDRLNDYREWREHGGFEPHGGDLDAALMIRAVYNVAGKPVAS